MSVALPPVKSGAGAGKHWIEKSAGQVMLGGVVSFTVMICVQLAV